MKGGKSLHGLFILGWGYMLKAEVFQKGFLKELDPRVKILSFLSISSIVAVTSKVDVIVLGLSFSWALFIFSKIERKAFLKAAFTGCSLALFVSFTLPFTVRGGPVYSMGPFMVSGEGLKFGALIFMKSSAIITLMILLISTSSPFSIIHALHHLRLPGRIVQLLFFTFRYIHVVREEYSKLNSALKLRCFRPGTNFHTYRTYAYLVATLLLRSYDRAERVYKAMLARGFRGVFPVLEHFELKKLDYVFSVISGVFVFSMIALSVL